MGSANAVALPWVELSGFDAGLTEEQQSIQKGLNRFAREVMRPVARELDAMAPSGLTRQDRRFGPSTKNWPRLGWGRRQLPVLIR